MSGQYEYFSRDTRASQMMVEKSSGASTGTPGPGSINLSGGTFVAPQWGQARNVAFHYRLIVGPVANKRQTVELYLSPLSAGAPREFLAFRYIYARYIYARRR